MAICSIQNSKTSKPPITTTNKPQQSTHHTMLQHFKNFKSLSNIIVILISLHILYMSFTNLSVFPRLRGSGEYGEYLSMIGGNARVDGILPNVLVVGERGSGVDLVTNWLVSSGACTAQFPDSNTTSSAETNFFNNPSLHQLGSAFYSNLFKHCKESNASLILDGTPETLFNPTRVYNTYKSVPGALDSSLKIVVMLREPMSREFYLFNQQNKSSSMEFEEYVKDVLKPHVLKMRSSGQDAVQQLTIWAKKFKRSQMLILSYDELEFNRGRFAWRLKTFLGSNLNGDLITDEEGDALARKIPDGAYDMLDGLYWGKNMELYHFLHEKRGPHMEHVPFQEFEYGMNGDVLLPNVLLLGAQFSGVSLITDLLIQNKACRATVFNRETYSNSKEPHFFDKLDQYNKGMEFYARRYKHCYLDKMTDIVIDGTPNYLTYPERVKELYNKAPRETLAKLKFIIVLREPVGRERQVYWTKKAAYDQAKDKKNGWFQDIVNRESGEAMSFPQYVNTTLLNQPDLLTESMYVDHLSKWFQLFRRHHFLILSYDELVNNPNSVQSRLGKFLGKELSGSLGKLGDDGNVDPRAKAVLSEWFREKNEELYKFLADNPGAEMEQNPFPRFGVSSGAAASV